MAVDRPGRHGRTRGRHRRRREQSLDLLRGLRNRRHLEDRQQRHHVDANLRRVPGRLHRRHRAGTVEPQHHLRRHGRAQQPSELVVRRRRLQVQRRREEVRVRGTERNAVHREGGRAPQGPQHGLRRCGRPSLRAKPGAWSVQVDRRRQDLDEHQVHRQRHGLHRSRDAPDRPEHALRRVLSAPAAAVGLQRRRTRQRHLADERRRQDLDAPDGQRAPDQPHPRPHRPEHQPLQADHDLRAARGRAERRHWCGRQRRRLARASPEAEAAVVAAAAAGAARRPRRIPPRAASGDPTMPASRGSS